MSISMLVIFPLTFASNVYVDPSTMPGWIQAVVDVNPISHLATAARGLMHGDVEVSQVGWVLLAFGPAARGVRAAHDAGVQVGALSQAGRRTTSTWSASTPARTCGSASPGQVTSTRAVVARSSPTCTSVGDLRLVGAAADHPAR